MKKLIIALLTAAAIVPATAQDIRVEGKINLRNVQVTQAHGTVFVEYDVEAEAKALKRGEGVVITPRVGAVQLPTVMVGDGRSVRSYIRAEAMAGRPIPRREVSNTIMKARHGRTTSRHYTAIFNLRSEQEGRPVELTSRTMRCCSNNDITVRRLTVDPLSRGSASSRPRGAEIERMVQWLQPEEEVVKRRESAITVSLTYPQGVSEVRRSFGDNAAELDRIAELLRPLFASGAREVRGVNIVGYASVEGNWGDNERLAADRAEGFRNWLLMRYGSPGNMNVQGRGEDWDGLLKLVEADTNMPGRWEAIDIMRNVGVFDGREAMLMKMHSGVTYRYMYRKFFPLLRRLEVTFAYEVEAVEGAEARAMMQERPGDLSHAEMQRTMREQGRDRLAICREIASLRPDDAVALINAANAEMIDGDLSRAWDYLKPVQDDPRAASAVKLYNQLSNMRETEKYSYKIVTE